MSGDAGVRQAWVEAARVAAELVAETAVAERWEQASVLAGMSVGGLASHLGRGVLQVGWFLDAAAPDSPTVTAVEYFARLRDTTDPASDLNKGIASRAQEVAERGPAALASDVRTAFEATVRRLFDEPAGRVVPVLHRPGEALLLDEYLKTRCIELSVHIEDLALSVGVTTEAPAAARALAVEVLVDAARSRHGDMAVLRALTRRERDHPDALRVL